MPDKCVSHSYTAAELADLLKKQAAERFPKPHSGAEMFHWNTWKRAVEGTLEWQAAEFLMRHAGPSERIEGSEVWKVIDWCLDVAKLEDMIGAPIKDSIPYEIGLRRGLTIAQNILNGWRPKKMPPMKRDWEKDPKAINGHWNVGEDGD